MRPLAAVLTLAALALVPAAAQAATPRQATHRIAHCLKMKAGARHVDQHGARGGKAFFTRPFGHFSHHYLRWGGYFTNSRNQVIGTFVVNLGLTRHQRRAANRCLKPFNGHL